MVTGRLTPDNKWIIVESDNHYEMAQLRLFFTKKINSWFVIKNKNPNAVVEETFMNSFGMIPVGLWMELISACQTYGYNLAFSDDFNCRIKNCSITCDAFKDYVNDLFALSDIKPMSYQVEGIYNVLQYKNCCVEVSTSGGKTLMSYILFKFMHDVLNLKHILFVTPKTNLTTQSGAKFVEYDKKNGKETNWTYSEIHATAKKKKKYDDSIVFGNYQSLCKKKADFFDKFDVVIIDECHHSTATSCRTIIKKCVNAKYKIGMTGTFPAAGTYDNFILQSYLGPIVYRLSSFDLINKENFATPVYVTAMELRYLDDKKLEALRNMRSTKDKNDVTAGNKLLNIEKKLARESRARFDYICNMIKNTTKNTLGIFSDVQGEYGKHIYQWLKENTDKNVFYIDGSTPTNNRDLIKAEMEEDDTGNTIIIASMQCFSEGIDIANLWNIFLLESTKSDVIVAQLLGRGMRRHPKKDKTMMIDFVDDFRFGGGYFNDNYLYRHGKERQAIYEKRGFPCKSFSIQLVEESPLLNK